MVEVVSTMKAVVALVEERNWNGSGMGGCWVDAGVILELAPRENTTQSI